MVFHEKLQLLRNQKNLSQEKLAELIGVSRQAVAKWELGQALPEIDKLIALSDCFHLSLDKLIKPDDHCSAGLIEGTDCSDSGLIDFLLRAKKSTYAAKAAESASSRPSSHDLHYEEGDFRYIDTYLGGEKFGGEEAVWKKSVPVWTMNYMGVVLDEHFSGDFLKEVLLRVPKDMPFRGPKIYRNGDYTYHCIVSGDYLWFQGYEEIYCADAKAYECYFHGGSIR